MTNLSAKEKFVLGLLVLLLLTLPILVALIRYQQQREIEGASPTEGATLSINKGDQFTNSRSVTLYISAGKILNDLTSSLVYGDDNNRNDDNDNDDNGDDEDDNNNKPKKLVVMQVSNDPNFDDADAQTFVPRLSWRLTDEDGTKTVYVRLGVRGPDDRGYRPRTKIEWGRPLSDSIILDTQPPDTTIVEGPEEGEVIIKNSVQFEVSGKDAR